MEHDFIKGSEIFEMILGHEPRGTRFQKAFKKICTNLENDSNCLTQPNIVRFSKFKSLKKADEYLYINIVNAHLHAIPLRLHRPVPEDNCLDFTGILFIR